MSGAQSGVHADTQPVLGQSDSWCTPGVRKSAKGNISRSPTRRPVEDRLFSFACYSKRLVHLCYCESRHGFALLVASATASLDALFGTDATKQNVFEKHEGDR
jgi:hypothetical protein